MNGSTQTVSTLSAAGDTDPGLQREVNEDRFHLDVSRGLFMVIDGVGGQAAGGKAADIALTMVRTRLERETGTVVDRVREAIEIANNEIHRVAGLRPEWKGMACVLTVVVVDDARAIVGHVGDTRLYKLRPGHIEKVTHDHSPVGEREDSREISELEAMRHPRRNEVYRDVGSDPHQPEDPDFIDVYEIPFEPDAALLLCSDGLTDLIDSSSIHKIVERLAGQPHQIVKALIECANEAGGKDNVSVVYVEGDQFASKAREESVLQQRTTTQRAVRLAVIALLAVVIATALVRLWPNWPVSISALRGIAQPLSNAGGIVVQPAGSIGAALQQAEAGSLVIVEPGEYRETLILRSNVRLVSRVPRGATIRLPLTASEADPAIVAADVTGAELVGFRIVGDASTPLGTGVLVRNSEVSVVDVEVTGAMNVAIDVNDVSRARASIVASDIHDKRKACHQGQAKHGSFREPYKQEAVAQGIRPAQEDRKPNGGQQMCDCYQQRITPDPTQPPYQPHDRESHHVEAAEQEYLMPELLARPDDQKRLQRREICRSKKRDDFRWRAAGICRVLADQPQPLRQVVQLPGTVDGSRSDIHTRDSTDVRQRPPLISLVDKEPKQLLRSKSPVVQVPKHCSHSRFELSWIGDRIQVHRLSAWAHVRRPFMDGDAADIGQSDGQYRHAGRYGYR